jgi:hypothetical protein
MLDRPSDELVIARLNLHEGQLSEYGKRVLRDGFVPDGIAPAARWLMGLEMVGKSDYLENKALDHNLGDGAFTMPATVALALCTVVPSETSTGATITEGSYTGYARKVIAASALSAAASGSKTNSEALVFAECTSGSSTIIGYAICDSSTKGAGNMLYFGSATSTVISTTQTPPTIATGGLVVTED